jgi:chaperonin cofactor prefoldin
VEQIETKPRIIPTPRSVDDARRLIRQMLETLEFTEITIQRLYNENKRTRARLEALRAWLNEWRVKEE